MPLSASNPPRRAMACEQLMKLMPTVEGEINLEAALKAAKLGSETWTPIAIALGDAEVQDTIQDAGKCNADCQQELMAT